VPGVLKLPSAPALLGFRGSREGRLVRVILFYLFGEDVS